MKIAHKSAAAQCPPTGPQTSHHLGLISDTYLSKFNAGFENCCQILDQFSKINTSICCKVKYQFTVVKSILYINQIHGKLVGGNFLFSNPKGFLFLLFIICYLCLILLISLSNHRLKGRNYFLI